MSDGLAAWQEILLGIGLLIAGLYLEDRIDQWRGRKRWLDRAADRLLERRDGE